MYDYLIIGHGLAGASLAQTLLEQGKKVYVLDQPQENISSSVAAGLYNPITGRSMVKTWKADEIFPEIEPFYRRLEQKLESRFLFPKSIYRPFANIEEQNDWLAKQGEANYTDYVLHAHEKPIQSPQLNDPFGGLTMKQTGYVDIPILLEASRKKLSEAGIYEESVFDEKELILGRPCRYKSLSFRKIIFCNGIQVKQSKFFGYLPFNAIKGEILQIDLQKPLDIIPNKGIFILAKDDGMVRVGSTYNRDYQSITPSQEGVQEIEEKLKALLHEKHSTIAVTSGIRPATRDRKPFIGKHPHHEEVLLFNGFGSKGVSLISYYAPHFAAYLDNKIELCSEANLKRYEKKYFS